VEPATFRRALVAEETRLLAVDWPMFLADAAPDRRAVLVDRMRRLTATA
jgi:hypothetical protein